MSKFCFHLNATLRPADMGSFPKTRDFCGGCAALLFSRAGFTLHVGCAKVGFAAAQVFERFFGETGVATFYFIEFFFREFLNFEQGVVGARCRAQEFIQFQLHSFAVAVLRVLDEEDHEKSDDGRRGVDNELPGVAVVKNRPRNDPPENTNCRQHESNGPPGPSRGQTGKFSKTAFVFSRLRVLAFMTMDPLHEI